MKYLFEPVVLRLICEAELIVLEDELHDGCIFRVLGLEELPLLVIQLSLCLPYILFGNHIIPQLVLDVWQHELEDRVSDHFHVVTATL